MTADAAGVSERERLARALFESGWKMPGTYPWRRQPKSTKDMFGRQAEKLLANGFGDVAGALRDAAAATELGDVRPRFNVRQRKWLLDLAAEYRTPSTNGGGE